MSEEVIKIFDYIGEKLGVAIDYTQDNIYPYLEDLWHRYITYEIIKNSIGCTVAIILILISLFIAKKMWISYKEIQNGSVKNNFFFYSNWRPEMTDISIILSILIPAIIVVCIAIIIMSLTCILEWALIPEKCMMELLGIIN